MQTCRSLNLVHNCFKQALQLRINKRWCASKCSAAATLLGSEWPHVDGLGRYQSVSHPISESDSFQYFWRQLRSLGYHFHCSGRYLTIIWLIKSNIYTNSYHASDPAIEVVRDLGLGLLLLPTYTARSFTHLLFNVQPSKSQWHGLVQERKTLRQSISSPTLGRDYHQPEQEK